MASANLVASSEKQLMLPCYGSWQQAMAVGAVALVIIGVAGLLGLGFLEGWGTFAHPNVYHGVFATAFVIGVGAGFIERVAKQQRAAFTKLFPSSAPTGDLQSDEDAFEGAASQQPRIGDLGRVRCLVVVALTQLAKDPNNPAWQEALYARLQIQARHIDEICQWEGMRFLGSRASEREAVFRELRDYLPRVQGYLQCYTKVECRQRIQKCMGVLVMILQGCLTDEPSLLPKQLRSQGIKAIDAMLLGIQGGCAPAKAMHSQAVVRRGANLQEEAALHILWQTQVAKRLELGQAIVQALNSPECVGAEALIQQQYACAQEAIPQAHPLLASSSEQHAEAREVADLCADLQAAWDKKEMDSCKALQMQINRLFVH